MKINKAYTPGEWYANTDKYGQTGMVLMDKGSLPVCEMHSVHVGFFPYNNKEEATANARLISAAPDLVEALIETLVRRKYEDSKGYSGDDENRLKRARENWWIVATPKELAALTKAGVIQ